KAISRINQDLLGFSSEKKLCQKICSDLVKIKRYKFIWMGLNENGNGMLTPIAIAGNDKHFVKDVKGSWGKYSFNGCPTSMALKRNHRFLNEDLNNVRRFVPWDKKATEEGFLSALILPIRYNSDVIGTFHVYSDTKNYFLKEEILFLKEVAGDIGLGIKSIKDDRNSTKSKIEYKELIKRISSCVVIYKAADGGNDFIIKDFNKAAEKVEKLRREDILDKSVLKIFPGIKDYGLFDVFKRVYKSGKSEDHPVSIYKDKRISGWRENYVYKLPNGNVVSVYNDLTDKKQSEDKLIRIYKKYKELVEMLPEVVVETDEKLNIKNISKRFKYIFGYNNADIKKGVNVLQLLDPGYLSLAKKNIEIIKRKGKKTPNEYKFVKKDGSTFYGLTNSNVIFGDDKQFSGLRIVGMDISESKKIQEALKENEEKYRTLVEKINEAIFIIQDGIIVFANHRAHKLIGTVDKDFIGKSFTDFIWHEDKEMVLSNYRKRISGKILNDSYDFRITGTEGEPIWVFTSVALVQYKGRPATLVMINNINDRKKAEEE
ncbi:MAG: PAS domain S-box protein, partial [Nitrososphaeraceae archaeon]